MKQPNLSALSTYFSGDSDKLVLLRYTFSVLDDEGKEKIYCELVCGNLGRHECFLETLSTKSVRGYVEYVCQFDTALLYGSEKDIFLPEKEEKKDGE